MDIRPGSVAKAQRTGVRNGRCRAHFHGGIFRAVRGMGRFKTAHAGQRDPLGQGHVGSSYTTLFFLYFIYIFYLLFYTIYTTLNTLKKRKVNKYI